ncbi:red chlorophyll catabolite reductase, chloroplastic [Cicer arietinum]|uniref:Red chlorophyll catabolite reductase, chloroplastic n=1 Tax=Cicer arietinum TaxID=3827 RepID=A0A1S2XK32_CICAR|nr:red chlorophyll catabolite reductase, chloroplastic [Cicer arietinum]
MCVGYMMEAMMIRSHFLHSPLSILSSYSSSSSSSSSSSRLQLSSSCSVSCSLMDTHKQGRSKFMEFPFVSGPHKNIMLDLISTLEDRFQSHLLPCSLPPDVQHYITNSGTSQVSLHIRPGNTDSPMDFVMGSWVHAELPTGGSLDITSLSAYLNSSNDAPNFVFELIRSSPTMLILVLDLPPRKDLVLWPDYLKTFYEDTKLDTHRQALEKVNEVQPYITSSLFIRTVASPTAIFVRIQTENDGGERMDEIIRNDIEPISKQVLGIWLDHCACAKRELGEEDRAYVRKRDGVIRNKTIEVDLGTSFPRLFGPEAANRILEAIKEYFTV